ncbi:hypothetical protein PAAG_08294 [Paracoccidioides lutzii Pb01]|uniref:Sex determining protein n=1 Tax=Paracoccidioides lutzii (strain ATCC MYA-826 / Pb01) TaxID=502779 RepID=C1HC03_PARBA|nr:hypothetical protein PAAG_08294 [Paracoccidioides lutzii Pb01]EEH38567.1 hypothetical protein PAAG_08294 [Paracoccidioides lutzii Pb01]
MFNWHTSVEPPPQGTPVSARQHHHHQHQHHHHQQQQQTHHSSLQWLPTGPPLPRPLPNTLPPISALRPTNNYVPTAQHDAAVLQTPASTDNSLSESPSIRETVVPDNGVDLAPEPAYDHPAPGPEPSSDDVDIDGGAASRQTGRVGPGRGVDLTLLESETPRKHGKRLTTREETALFEICNRHAASFGERNRLCEWWLNVTQEFTASEGHPYSWHSVRRKVELVTQQRIKFLEGLDGKRGDDQADAAWSAAVDSWIPSWKRFQEQENERIHAKQGKRGRKRKSVVDADGVAMGYQHMLPPGFDTMFPSSSKSAKATRIEAPVSIPVTSDPPPTPSTTESLLTPTHQQRQQQQQQKHTSASVPVQTSVPQAPVSASQAIITAGTSSTATESAVGAAILETLSKLNKNLEAVSSRNHSSNAMSLAAAAAAAAAAHPHAILPPHQQKHSPNSAVTNHNHPAHSHGHGHTSRPGQIQQNQIPASTLHQLKSELRAELRQEIQKDRAQLEEKLDSVQKTQEMILDLLRQEPQ